MFLKKFIKIEKLESKNKEKNQLRYVAYTRCKQNLYITVGASLEEEKANIKDEPTLLSDEPNTNETPLLEETDKDEPNNNEHTLLEEIANMDTTPLLTTNFDEYAFLEDIANMDDKKTTKTTKTRKPRKQTIAKINKVK